MTVGVVERGGALYWGKLGWRLNTGIGLDLTGIDAAGCKALGHSTNKEKTKELFKTLLLERHRRFDSKPEKAPHQGELFDKAENESEKVAAEQAVEQNKQANTSSKSEHNNAPLNTFQKIFISGNTIPEFGVETEGTHWILLLIGKSIANKNTAIENERVYALRPPLIKIVVRTYRKASAHVNFLYGIFLY